MSLSNLSSIFDATQRVAPVPTDDLEQDSSSDTHVDVGRGSLSRRLVSGSLALIAVGLVVTTGRSIVHPHPSSERLPIGEMPGIFSLIEMNGDLAPYFTRTTEECRAYLQKTIMAHKGAPHPPCKSGLKACTVTTSLKIRKGFDPMFVTRDPKVENVCVPYSCRSEDLKADMTRALKANLEQQPRKSEHIMKFGALDVSNCEGDSAENEEKGHGPSIVA